jgi:hypothetical protein
MNVALLAQNLLDDVASVYEKIQGLFNWSDKMVT